jgi:hypothetical protein
MNAQQQQLLKVFSELNPQDQKAVKELLDQGGAQTRGGGGGSNINEETLVRVLDKMKKMERKAKKAKKEMRLAKAGNASLDGILRDAKQVRIGERVIERAIDVTLVGAGTLGVLALKKNFGL